MDKATWQAKIREQLTQSGDLLRRMAPGLVYGALSTATLLPVVTAIQRGDYTVYAALAQIVGGAGLNLVANQIQAWKERDPATLRQELPPLLHAAAAESAEWLAHYEDYATNVDETLAANTGRVVSGGSFDLNQLYVRCAARNYYATPNYEDFHFGFRVVLSPFPLGADPLGSGL